MPCSFWSFSLHLQLPNQEAILREVTGVREKSDGLQVLHPSWEKAAEPGCLAPCMDRRQNHRAVLNCLLHVAT